MFGAYRGFADLYVIGTQESGSADEWERLVTDHLLPADFVKVRQWAY